MKRAVKLFGQAVVLGLMGWAMVYLSVAPNFTHHDPEAALVKLTLAHSGERVEECRRRSAQELADRAPNMRRPTACGRERVPIALNFWIDGDLTFTDSLVPTGLAKDGPSKMYKKFPVSTGRHILRVQMRDSRRSDGYDYDVSETVDLRAAQNLTIDFDASSGVFTFE